MVCMTKRQMQNRMVKTVVGKNTVGAGLTLPGSGSGLTLFGEGLRTFGQGLTLYGSGNVIDFIRNSIKKGLDIFLPGINKQKILKALKSGGKTVIKAVLPALKKEALRLIESQVNSEFGRNALTGLTTTGAERLSTRLDGSGMNPMGLNRAQINFLRRSPNMRHNLVMDRHSKNFNIDPTRIRDLRGSGLELVTF